MNAEEIRRRLNDPRYLDRAFDSIADDLVSGRRSLSEDMKPRKGTEDEESAKRDAIRLLCEGATYKEAAAHTGLSFNQVKHLKSGMTNVKRPYKRRSAA